MSEGDGGKNDEGLTYGLPEVVMSVAGVPKQVQFNKQLVYEIFPCY